MFEVFGLEIRMDFRIPFGCFAFGQMLAEETVLYYRLHNGVFGFFFLEHDENSDMEYSDNNFLFGSYSPCSSSGINLF